MHERSKNRYPIFFYVLLTISIILVLSQKSNLHIDELLSYGLSNSFDSNAIAVDWGISYDSDAIERMFSNYLSADSNATFNYEGVWKNQAGDVHPPLYYAILHTISSFFPGNYSVWFSGSINIIFALLTLYVLRKLAGIMFQTPIMRDLASVMFVFSAAILSATSFLRMYIIAVFFTTLITYFFVKMADEQWIWRHYFFLFATSVLSALTHYYCVVYLVFICAVYGVWLLKKKTWKHLAAFVGTMALSGVSSIAIFPAMLEHVFSGYRGANSIDNFTNTSLSDYLDRLTYFYGVFNQNLFGSVLTYIIVFLVIIAVLTLMARAELTSPMPKKVQKNELEILRWCLIVIPTLLYFFLIAKIAVYHSERYMVPIYVTSIISFMGLIDYVSKKHIPASTQNIFLCCICAIALINGWQAEEWTYLYANSHSSLDKIAEYSDVDCLVIYDSLHDVQTTYDALTIYDSVTFIDKYTYYWIAEWECAQSDELILMLVGTSESEIQGILALCPNLDSYQRLGSYGHGTVYYLY